MVKASTAVYTRLPVTALFSPSHRLMVGFLAAPAPPLMHVYWGRAMVLAAVALRHSATHCPPQLLRVLTLPFDSQVLPVSRQNFHSSTDVRSYPVLFAVQAEACYTNDWCASPGAYRCGSAACSQRTPRMMAYRQV